MTTEAPAPPQSQETTTPEAQAEKSRQDIFRWSAWVHVGEGAEDCDKRFEGCTDEQHFHAWVRLPNPFQIRDITEKARAAKARRVKLLRDPDSDPRVILEEELDELRETDKQILVDEIVDKDFPDDYTRAVRAVEDMDDPDFVPEDEKDKIPKLYADMDQHREEYDRQRQLPEEQRSDDFPVLEKLMADYSHAVEAELKAIQAPRREHLMERDMDDLVDIVRRDRIEVQAMEAYLHTYNTWMWFVCTYKPRLKGTPKERVWKDINQMKFETPSEVIEKMRETFDELESRMSRSRQAKNS